MPEVAEHDDVGRRIADLLRQHSLNPLGDRAVVEGIHLEQVVTAGHDGILVRGRPRAVDDRRALDARLLEILERELRQRVVAKHGRERHLGAGRRHMLGDDTGAADEVLAAVEPHAHGRRLGHAADHGAVRIAVDDRVADDVNPDAPELVERAPISAVVSPSASRSASSFSVAIAGGSVSIRRDEE